MPWFHGGNPAHSRLARQSRSRTFGETPHGATDGPYSSTAWDLPLEEASYFVLDIETSGFAPQTDIVLSIASAQLHLQNLNLDAFHASPGQISNLRQQITSQGVSVQNLEYELVKHPDTSFVPAHIWELTGLTPQALDSGREWRDVLFGTLKRTGASVWVAHHARHELSFLQKSARDFWRLRLHPIVIDTALVAQALLGHPQTPTLDEVCAWFDVPVGTRHHADEDVRMTALVWQREASLCKVLGLSTVGEVIEWALARAQG